MSYLIYYFHRSYFCVLSSCRFKPLNRSTSSAVSKDYAFGVSEANQTYKAVTYSVGPF